MLTDVAVWLGLDAPTVADMGELPDSPPTLGLPVVPFTLATLGTIVPIAVTLAFVGLLESLLTGQLIDDVTDTPSDRTVRAAARASPTSPPASWAAWPAAPWSASR